MFHGGAGVRVLTRGLAIVPQRGQRQTRRKTAERTWCTCLIVDVVGLKTAYQTRYRAVVVTGCRTGEDVSAHVLCVCPPSTHIDIRTRPPWYAALDWLILCFIIIIIIICMCCGVFSVKLSLCRLKVYWLKVHHSGADGKWHRFTTTTSAFGSELFLWRSLQLRPCNPLPLPEGLPKNFWGLHFWTLEWDFLQAWKCPSGHPTNVVKALKESGMDGREYIGV